MAKGRKRVRAVLPNANILLAREPPFAKLDKDVMDVAVEWGFVVPRWKLKDYLKLAAEDPQMTTTTVIWGPTGAGKSSMMLLHGYFIYQDWDTVLEHVMFHPNQIIEVGKELSERDPAPWIAWDDIIVHFPSLAYRKKIDLYMALDSYFAIKRTIMKNFVTTLPSIKRLPANIYDNTMLDGFEVFIGRNRHYVIHRCFQLPQLYTVKERIAQFKVRIEQGSWNPFKHVPEEVYRRYETSRKRLGEEAARTYEQAIKKLSEEIEGAIDTGQWLSAITAAEILGIKPTSLLKNFAGVMRMVKREGKAYIHKEDFEEYLRKFGTPEQYDLYRSIVG